MLRRFALLAVLLLVPCAPSRAAAETEAEARMLAQSRYQEGVAAYEQGRFKDAVDLLLSADRALHSPLFSYNIAIAYDAMRDAPSALRYYRTYLREVPTAEDRATVEGRISALESTLQERGLQQATVVSSPEGATVVIDGKPLGLTPWTGELLPGRHRVSVELRGYPMLERTIDVLAHRAQDFPFDLQPPAPAPAARAPEPIPPPIADEAPSSGSRIGPLTWIALGAGGLSLGAALYFEISRASSVDEARDAPQIDYRDKLDTARADQTAARVLAGIGGALVVTGGALLFLDLSREPDPPVAVGCSGAGCFATARGVF